MQSQAAKRRYRGLVLVVVAAMLLGLVPGTAQAAPLPEFSLAPHQVAPQAEGQIHFLSAPADAQQYGKYEATFGLAFPVANPFDPDEVRVDVHFLTPSGAHLVQPAFYYQGYSVAGVESWDEVYTLQGAPSWMVRFTPRESGPYQFYVVAISPRYGTSTSAPRSFMSSPAISRGFVGVSSANPNYFAFDDGQPFIGVGLNVGWWNDACEQRNGTDEYYVKKWRLANYRQWFSHMTAKQANLGRIWLLGARSYAGHMTSIVQPATPGRDYDLEAAWAFDQVLAAAEAGGIYLLLTLDDIQQYGSRPAALFGMDPDRTAAYIAALNGGEVTPAVHDEFRSHCTVLGNAAKAYPVEPSRSWRILDGVNSYFVQVQPADGGTRQVLVAYPLAPVLAGPGYRPAETWHLNPYFGACPGFDCTDPAAIFTNEQLQKYQRQLFRYIVARWGYSTSIVDWELFNEVTELDWPGNAQAMVEWHTKMAQYIKSIDAHRHLVSTSSGSYKTYTALFGQPELEVAQIHYYYATDVTDSVPAAGTCTPTDWAVRASVPYGQDMANMVRYHAFRLLNSAPGKPALVGEFGLENFGNPDAGVQLRKQDPTGIHVHNGLWSSIMSGMAAGALPWHFWNELRSEADYWPEWWQHFPALARYVADVDVEGLTVLKPLNVNLALACGNDPRPDVFASADPKLRALGLRNEETLYAWFQNVDSTWYNAAAGNRAQPLASRVTIRGLKPGQNYAVEWFDTWSTDTTSGITSTRVKADATGAVLLDLGRPPFPAQPDVAVKLHPVDCLPSPVVMSPDDHGLYTLRQALIDACPGSVIMFHFPGQETIQLQGSPLVIDRSLTIQGPGAGMLTIFGSEDTRIFDIKRGATVTISGLRLARGRAQGTAVNANAGGAILNDGNLTLRACVVTENRAEFGGAIHNFNRLTVENSFFDRNAAQGLDNSGGGAIYNAGGRVRIIGTRLTNNQAQGAGGALVSWFGGTTEVVESTLDANRAALGGAIENGCDVVAATCSTLKLTNSTLSNNQAGSAGGALINYANGRVDIASSTLAANSAPNGHTIAMVAGITPPELIGQVFMTNTVRLAQSIVSGAADLGCLRLQPGGRLVDGGNNLRWPDIGCVGAIGDPKLQPLADNGGSTPTHALGAASAAIDQVPAGACLASSSQNGLVRPQGTLCDIGAYEVAQAPVHPTRGRINIAVTAQPQSVRNFRFFGAFGEFSLDDPPFDDGDGVPNLVSFTDVAPGRHCFSQPVPFRWSLAEVTCNWPDACRPDATGDAYCIDVAAGDEITATFHNRQQGSLFVHSYRDANGSRSWDEGEPLLGGWWSEVRDVSENPWPGTLFASNFTNENGVWDVYTLQPGHQYQVCQKPQEGWSNTQPGQFDPAAGNWPCYTFRVQPAQLVEAWFGYAPDGAAISADADGRAATTGIRIIDNFVDAENDAMYTEEEFVDVHAQTPHVAHELYLPKIDK